MKLRVTFTCLAVFAMTASADIDFLGGLVGTNTSWAGGVLPVTSGNPGVIGSGDAGEVGNNGASSAQTSVVGLYIRQEGGNISSTSFQGSEFDSTTWTVNGGTLGTTQGQDWKNGSLLTLNSGGTVDVTGGRDFSVNASTFTMNGGTFDGGDEFKVIGGGVFNMNGGSFTTGGGFASGFGSSGTINFNAGTISGSTLSSKNNTVLFSFGSGSGSASFSGFYTAGSESLVLDWASDSEKTLTITGADAAFYESKWDAGELTIDGTNAGTFAASGFFVSGETLSLVDPALIPPSAPSGLVAAGGISVVNLKWDDSGDDVASYSVYRSTTSGNFSSALATNLSTSAYSDNAVINGTTYYYAVTAVGTNGIESGFSDPDSATPVSLIPTTFIGGSTNNFISNAANWDNGLPVGVGKQGTISTNAGYDSNVGHSGYNVVHTAGTISRAAGSGGFSLGSGTVWFMDGAAAAITGTRGLSVNAAQFTLNQGNADLTGNARDTSVSGASGSITINGGSMSVGRDFIMSGGGVFTINGGTLTINQQIYCQSFASAAGAINFNGGTATADKFQFDTACTVTFGGSTAGSLTLDSYGNGATLDWFPGTQISLSITNETNWVNWAEALWNAALLTYDGEGNGILGTWADVTAVDGLEPGVRFSYDAGTKTLSLTGDAPSGGYTVWAAGWSTNIGAATFDFDNDGVNNFYEYGLDGNPTNALDQGTLPEFSKTGSTFIYVHPMRSDDTSLTYTVETRTNLVSGVWTTEGYTVMGTNVTGGTLDFVTNDVDTVENEKFIRLRIEQ